MVAKLDGVITTADLGASSDHTQASLCGLKWRMVPWEQQLTTGQSDPSRSSVTLTEDVSSAERRRAASVVCILVLRKSHWFGQSSARSGRPGSRDS